LVVVTNKAVGARGAVRGPRMVKAPAPGGPVSAVTAPGRPVAGTAVYGCGVGVGVAVAVVFCLFLLSSCRCCVCHGAFEPPSLEDNLSR
jgi:hypothetical protein